MHDGHQPLCITYMLMPPQLLAARITPEGLLGWRDAGGTFSFVLIAGQSRGLGSPPPPPPRHKLRTLLQAAMEHSLAESRVSQPPSLPQPWGSGTAGEPEPPLAE